MSSVLEKLVGNEKYVCCKDSLETAKRTVKAKEGPNAVYCKDEHCIYYHPKTLEARIKQARKQPFPHGDVAKEIIHAMLEAKKVNPSCKPKLVRLE